jgi:hypothetical protein
MQKKSNPVALLSVLLVLALVLAVGGVSGFFTNPGRFFQPEPPKPKAPPPTAESTDKSKKSAADELRSARAAQAARMGEEEGATELINGVPKEPTLVIPEAKIFKPTVNDSNISAQWYREESRQKARAEQKERERQAASGTS